MSFDLIENIRRHGFKCLLLAVSGGLDSICLAHYFIENRNALGIEWLGIAHVHHGLREGTADRDAKFVEEFAKSHDVPFFLKRLDGEALKNAEGSLEENARDGRYKALVEIVKSIVTLEPTGDRVHENGFMDPSTSLHSTQDDEGRDPIAIVTAHHAGDQAETMYMRLRRGTTLAGLRGIQETRVLLDDNISLDSSASPQNDESLVSRLSSLVYIYRPLLNVTRAELLDYARKNRLNWCEDESNADVKFARNKIRHDILPQLEHECSGATKQLGRIAELADKAYAKVMEKCDVLFSPCLNDEKLWIPSLRSRMTIVEDDAIIDPSTTLRFAQDDKKEVPAQGGHDMWRFLNKVRHDNTNRAIALDKKKLNRILQAHKEADLSELFRLWLSEKGFRFPMGFFYAPKEPAHLKIPVRAVYRKRSIVKIRNTVRICEFKDALMASKFVSCEMNEKDYNEST